MYFFISHYRQYMLSHHQFVEYLEYLFTYYVYSKFVVFCLCEE